MSGNRPKSGCVFSGGSMKTILDNAACLAAAKDPKPGDYWHECFSPGYKVVARLENHVIILRAKSVDKDHWTWDVDQPELLSIDEFVSRLTYDTMPDKTHCNVIRGEKNDPFVEYFARQVA